MNELIPQLKTRLQQLSMLIEQPELGVEDLKDLKSEMEQTLQHLSKLSGE